ncbi:hypothetical protein HQ47_06005 [Porphyromonas macacae]|uniref:Uncharacterized protein n=1 Tax=Porphyromonas macacae TaxID=28115 RepID=A0A0A2E978_9PORP|nr:hypothetical protein HQ47_06005 [Porphyromonas macacae]
MQQNPNIKKIQNGFRLAKVNNFLSTARLSERKNQKQKYSKNTSAPDLSIRESMSKQTTLVRIAIAKVEIIFIPARD